MCIAFPGRVIEVDESGALVETDGRRRRASVLLIPDIVVGEWVAVAAGTIVDRLDEREAAEIKALLDRANHPASSDVRAIGIRGDRHVHAS
jgi:hydrogenase expression/formation protein HypC